MKSLVIRALGLPRSLALYTQIILNLCKLIPFVLIFKTVVMKLMAPNKEEIPDKCKLKIAKSTEAPEWL